MQNKIAFQPVAAFAVGAGSGWDAAAQQSFRNKLYPRARFAFA